MIELQTPLSELAVRALDTGDTVFLSGIIVTARDAAHKYIIDNFIDSFNKKEQAVYDKLKKYLDGGVIYHCGPIVRENAGKYTFVSAGPTTSIREEPYEDRVIEAFKVRGVIGKGGMGDKTLAALKTHGAAYFHAVGGAGVLIADNTVDVIDVLKLDFGIPEALWVIKVKELKLTVTMDSMGRSMHKDIEALSAQKLKEAENRLFK